MLKSILRFFGVDSDPADIGESLFQVIEEGDLVTVSKRKVVLDGGADGKFVLKGKFDIEAGEATGGTIKGYTAFANGEKLMKASGFKVDFAELKAGLESSEEAGFQEAVGLLLSADRAYGSKHDDAIVAISGRIKAGDGDDFIVSEYIDKRIYGEDGNDTIIAGTGSDILFGGKGRDLFVLRGVEDGLDDIRDFKVKKDKIGLDGTDFETLGGAVDAAEFVIGSEATTAAHHLIYDDNTGALYWDADGVGGKGKTYLAILDPGLKLAAANFSQETLL